ncbi:hypothetical protein CASFOL_036820 [Castilleja foliolosa]|uniref:Uncharacterized protein n=1 Tax=Castilleja foliolosa TaxID=1961234 RepID=A0ABD3BP88_9LAMI
MATKIVEQFEVAPPSGVPTEQLLKLLHMDMPCSYVCRNSLLLQTPLFRITFHGHHCKIFIDNNSGMPVSQYIDGQDSLSLTIAVSYADFLDLTGFHPGDAAQLHGLAPELSDTFTLTSKLSVITIQLTLFPNQGICIGITGNHAIGDATAFVLIMKKWASINRDDSKSGNEFLPSYNRDLVRDGYQRAMECWSDISTCLSLDDSSFSKVSLNNMVEATLGEEADHDKPDYFMFSVNCRGRLNPPLPDNYFGNCSAMVTTESTY